MLRLPSVFCLICFTVSALAQEYQSKELADAARDWRQELIDSVPANKKQPNLVAALRRTAEIEYQAKDYAAAIGKLTSAVANGADDGLVWLRLAQSELAAGDDHAMASAYNAYLKSTDPVERGVALFVIGHDYDRHDKQKEALAALDAGLNFTQSDNDFSGSPQPTPTSSQRNTSGRAGWKRLGPVVTMRSRSLGRRVSGCWL